MKTNQTIFLPKEFCQGLDSFRPLQGNALAGACTSPDRSHPLMLDLPLSAVPGGRFIFIVAVCLLLMVSSSAHGASDPWTNADTARQLLYTAVTVADWNQTLHISRNPEKYYETNDFLGKHPSKRDVNSYFASMILTNALIASLLPKDYRASWQVFWIGYESIYVKRNIGIGLNLSF